MATLSKSILYQADVQAIKPDFQAVKFLAKPIAEKTQTIIFQKEQNKLSLITTNNFPEELQDLKMKLQAKGYLLDIFYTTTDGFHDALERYHQIEDQESQQKTALTKLQNAEGKSALVMIKELLKNKS